MRRVLLLGLVALAVAGCSDEICDPKEGASTCGYCAQDRATTSNPHAGMCRYCGPNTTCSGDICGDALRCESKVIIYVPKATFLPSNPPPPSGSGTAPRVAMITPSAGSLTMGSTMEWTIHWDVTTTITAVLFKVAAFSGGHFKREVTPDESNAGTLVVPMVEAAEPPGESGCLGTMTCWAEAPATATTADLMIALVGAGDDVGVPTDGLSVAWERPSYPQSTPTTTGPGCPTTGAELGCCTTSNGIQVVGVGLSTQCTCPSGTCFVRTGYCGCMGCGGC